MRLELLLVAPDVGLGGDVLAEDVAILYEPIVNLTTREVLEVLDIPHAADNLEKAGFLGKPIDGGIPRVRGKKLKPAAIASGLFFSSILRSTAAATAASYGLTAVLAGATLVTFLVQNRIPADAVFYNIFRVRPWDGRPARLVGVGDDQDVLGIVLRVEGA